MGADLWCGCSPKFGPSCGPLALSGFGEIADSSRRIPARSGELTRERGHSEAIPSGGSLLDAQAFLAPSTEG